MYEFESHPEIFGLLQEISVIAPENNIRVAELAISFDNVREPINLLKEITAQKIANEGNYNIDDVRANLDTLRNLVKETRRNNIQNADFMDRDYFIRVENLAVAILEKRYIYNYDIILPIVQTHEPVWMNWVDYFF